MQPPPSGGEPGAAAVRGLRTGPLLIGLAVAVPDVDRRAVARSGAGGVEAEVGVADAGDGQVGVQLPSLIRRTRAVLDCDGTAGAGAESHALVGVHRELLVGGPVPALVATTVAVPQIQGRAVRRREARDVDAAVAAHTAQHLARRR